jgi:hypothetical protein
VDAVLRWLRTMLNTQPVYLDDNQLWQVFSYADVGRILSDPATFSSDTTTFTPAQPDLDLFFKGDIAL